MLNKKDTNAEKYLDYILRDNKSYEIAMSKYTCNPVLQMGNPKVFNLFTKKDLKVIQYDSLADSNNYSHEYQIVPNYKKLLRIFNKNYKIFNIK